MKKQVKVKPNSKQASITEAEDGSLTVRLLSPPVDGKANQELIEQLAKHFGVAKREVRICSGAGSRTKIVEIRVESDQG